MNARRLLPYIIGLALLAFALGSLPRGSPGGSLLFQSTWLLYLFYLGPVIALGLMIVVIILIAANWREMGNAIGFGIARSRMSRKKKSRYSFFISAFVWAIAIGILITRKGTIFNPSSTNSTTIVGDITGQGGTPQNPFLGGPFYSAISGLVQNSWFDVAFLGLLVVGGLVLVQSIRASFKETSEINIQELQARQIEGLQAANEAIGLVDDQSTDPRSRIINCYQRMIAAVSGLGIPISADQTARELEKAISSTFALKGEAANDLTNLFEEARYSLHEIGDEDATRARQDLESIAEELKIQLDS